MNGCINEYDIVRYTIIIIIIIIIKEHLVYLPCIVNNKSIIDLIQTVTSHISIAFDGNDRTMELIRPNTLHWVI